MADVPDLLGLLKNEEMVKVLRKALGLPEERELPQFRDLASSWYESAKGRLVDPGSDRRAIERLNKSIGEKTEATLRPRHILDAILAMTDLANATKNKVRSTGMKVVDFARLNSQWLAGNPFQVVKKFKQVKRVRETLSIDEARRVLNCVRDDRRDMFRVALAMGCRKGELMALKKTDVSLEKRSVWIHRSHGRDQTKTGRERRVPIPQTCFDAMMRAMVANPDNELLFPAANGRRMRRDTELSVTLRAAMRRAGIVTGYVGKCRRRGCGHREPLEFPQAKPCPKCSYMLLCCSTVRQMRFQDLRRSAATLHRQAGCDPTVAKMLLGHAAVGVHEDSYLQLSFEFQQLEVNKLSL